MALLRSSIVALAVAIAGPIPASVPTPIDITDQRAPKFNVYASQDGLSDEIWSTIGFDREGFAWAGSASQLARFDGYRWQLGLGPAARSLVRDAYSDPDGDLWVVFEREGLARYDGRRWEFRDDVTGYMHRFCQVRLADGSSQGWLAHDGGFSVLVNGRWVADPGNHHLPPGTARAITQTERLYGQPRQWMTGPNAGLYFREREGERNWGPWRQHPMPGFSVTLATDLAVSYDHGQEELWILSYGGGLARIRQHDLRIWRSASGELPSEAMYSAVVTYASNGERLLWVSTRAGLLRIRGEEVGVFDRRHGLPADAVRGIKLQRGLDGVDLLWLATEGGVVRVALSDSQWQTVSLTGARENGILGLLLEPDDSGGERLWLGTQQRGLHLLHQRRWRQFQQADGSLPGEGVRGIWRLPGADGGVLRLVGLNGGELLRIDDDLRLSVLPTPWPRAPEEAVTEAISRRVDGELEHWFGLLTGGTWRHRSGQWQQFTLPSADTRWSVNKLLAHTDAGGRQWLWAASSLGLARLNGAQWELLSEGLGLPADGLRTLSLIERQDRIELWLGSSRSGVIRLDVSDPAAPVRLSDADVPSPPDPTVYSILADGQDRLYVCTNNGVQQLTPDAGGGYQQRTFTRADGLVHDECNTNSQFVDASDRYWLGTLGGLSLYDPNSAIQQQATVPKALHFTDLRVDGNPTELTDADAYRFAPGTREVRIGYTVLAQMRERESSYRSRLIGHDPDFTPWTTERSRSFSALPPGDYEFVVQGRDYAGTRSRDQSLRFSLAPRWWQHPMTQLFALIASLALVLLAVMAYNRGLRRRQRALKQLVAARTADLNAANERLTELSFEDPLTGLANRRRLMQALDTALDRARNQSLPVGLMVIDVDLFKDYNDRHGHLAGDAALRAVAQALQAATREQDLVARFGGEEFACLMTDADAATVARVAERMRALVEALPPRSLGNDSHTVTISIGTISCIPAAADGATGLLERADQALYRAKGAGRNCVRNAD